MNTGYETAILAGGCFWGLQHLLRDKPGVISTRVGYSGGDVKNATYRDHGSHAEAVEIVFDPAIISYRQILGFMTQPPLIAKATILAPVIAQGFTSQRMSRR